MEEETHIWLATFESEGEFIAFYKQSREFHRETSFDYNPDDVDIYDYEADSDLAEHNWLSLEFNRFDHPITDFVSLHSEERYAALVELLANKNQIKEFNTIIYYGDSASGRSTVFDGRSIDSKVAQDYIQNWAQAHPETPINYLGVLNERRMKALRKPLNEASLAIESSWWLDIPTNEKELDELKKDAESSKISLPALAKLTFMYSTGTAVEPDRILAKQYRKYVAPYPELLGSCLKANAESGNADAWVGLYSFYLRKFHHSVTDEDLLTYLENACELGSRDAKWIVAKKHMQYGYGSLKIKRNLFRAEELLLELYETDHRADVDLRTLYGVTKTEVSDAEKALYWTEKYANRTGDFIKLAYIFLSLDVEVGNEILMCKAIYLAFCVNHSRRIEKRYVDKLDKVSIEAVKAGRKLAKEWIKENGFKRSTIRYSWDSFEQYLIDREE